MTKYQIVLLSAECPNFVDRLRELGLVDITTEGYEPSEDDRDLIIDVEQRLKAERWLEDFEKGENFDDAAGALPAGAEIYAEYKVLSQRLSDYTSKITLMEKAADEARPWGEFSSADLQKLEKEGLKLNYFVAHEDAYEKICAERDDLWIIPISSIDPKVYFVVVEREGESTDLNIDALVQRPLQSSASEAEAEILELEKQIAALNKGFSRIAVSIDRLKAERAKRVEELERRTIKATSEQASEGQLMVLEAWSPKESTKDVDELLDRLSGLIYFKSEPTPQDNTPVHLKNNSWAKNFELVSNLYAIPKYGTIDLTAYFAPFYTLFFAICLCDAGYGAFILAAGIFLKIKDMPSLRSAANLSIFCGLTALVFGFFANSVFGMEFSSLPAFADFPFINFQQDFFSVAMILGMIQILFGMTINIAVTTRRFGVRYALGRIGWFGIICASIASALLTNMGISGFGFDSIPFYGLIAIFGVLLFFFNSPEKGILGNVSGGLMAVYDGTTGLLGDVLSYIRLFAIGLSGGVLALVFNDLALGMTGLNEDLAGVGIASIIVKVIIAAVIILFGHTINLFMSSISAMVHPMRLTFVEFYKNAGFEMGARKFNPLMKK